METNSQTASSHMMKISDALNNDSRNIGTRSPRMENLSRSGRSETESQNSQRVGTTAANGSEEIIQRGVMENVEDSVTIFINKTPSGSESFSSSGSGSENAQSGDSSSNQPHGDYPHQKVAEWLQQLPRLDEIGEASSSETQNPRCTQTSTDTSGYWGSVISIEARVEVAEELRSAVRYKEDINVSLDNGGESSSQPHGDNLHQIVSEELHQHPEVMEEGRVVFQNAPPISESSFEFQPGKMREGNSITLGMDLLSQTVLLKKDKLELVVKMLNFPKNAKNKRFRLHMQITTSTDTDTGETKNGLFTKEICLHRSWRIFPERIFWIPILKPIQAVVLTWYDILPRSHYTVLC